MHSATQLRPGTRDDIDAMYRLDLVCFAEPFRFDPGFMRRCASGPKAVVIVAESDETVFGFVIANLARRRAPTSAYITTLDVHPEYRREGMARRLMEEVERRVSESGASAIWLHVSADNVGAIGFYEAMGYIQKGSEEGFYGPALDAWVYWKALSG